MHWSGWRLPGNSCRRRPGGQPADAGKPGPAAAKAAAIDAAQARPLTWKTVVKRALAVATAGAAFYLVLPKLTAVLGVWPQLSTLNPVALAAELASFTCNFALQRLALPTKDWFPVVTAGLAGNAVTNTLPGGDAAGAAVQSRMLTTAGFDTDTAVGGLTTFSLPGAGGLLALPLFALPTILGGAAVSPGSPIPPCSVSPGSSCTRPWARSSCAPAGRWQRSAARRSGCGTGSPRAPAAGDRPGHPAGGRARHYPGRAGRQMAAGGPADHRPPRLRLRLPAGPARHRSRPTASLVLAGPSAYLLFRHRYGWPVPRRATPGEGGQPAADG